jgi:PhzF family phenazine biosynthesis protein
MKIPLYWVDAFADKVFTGNPAAVVPLTQWLPDAVMQQIAFENGLAETAFFAPAKPSEALAKEGRYHLRWFTPAVEVDLCGHATLASAFVLFTQLGLAGDTVVFDSRSGPLTVTRQGNNLLELDFPSRPPQPCATPAALANALGAVPDEVAQARDTVCIFPREEDVRALRPDFAALAQLDTYAVIATAPGRDCDFVSRFFAPRAGINEDSVTGSAHCTLTPYWSARLGKTKLHARQISARGGELWCELRDARVGIAGRAVLYLRGEIGL